ncbi:hypothetical protein [Streptomyces sp. NBC_01744]|uniref:hypothetical protein n=1 Tax=Streptomyces sp. NBC_01744 TaxID=2975927 RepID=UPI003D9A17ED|nr:hypothetical protein OIE70_36350 [Streptomyces sp. NBC_01744]
MFWDPEIPKSAEETAAHFVQVWAEAVLRQAARTREVRKRSAIDERAWERQDDWPGLQTEQIEANWRTVWAEEHTLVWSAYQLERWQARLAKERGEPAPPENKPLRLARNALEHLDELHLEEFSASIPEGKTPKQAKRMAISSFPGEVLSLDGSVADEVLDHETLDREALNVVRTIQQELDEWAQEQFAELMRDR